MMRNGGLCRGMSGWHLVLAAVGLLFFLWFFAPVFAGVCNIGNVTGMAASAMLVCFGLFFSPVSAWLRRFSGTRGGRAVCVAAALLAAAVLLTALAETALMVRAAHNQPPENATAIVLGCKVNGTKPSTVLSERIDAAYRYLQENPGAVCVLSGGRGKDERISEAECMLRELTGKGIAPERLLLEDASTDTRENLEYSMALLRERGLEGPVTIVTSEFHAYRAGRTAERLGITAYSTPSRTFFLYLPTFYVRELYGILYYWIR